MGTFIVSFIGNSFIEGARGTQPMQLLEPDPDKQRRILVVVFFTIIIAFITWVARGGWGFCRGSVRRVY